MLPLVHHPDYVAPLPEGHRFPMQKFARLQAHLEREGVADEDNVFRPAPPRRPELELVHEPAYLNRFLTGRLDRQAERRMGLPWSARLVRRTCIAVGGTVRTAELALAHGLACNTAGGTHHAMPDFGAGFCILNDLAVAARVMRRRGAARRILIVDLDVHQGDGTAVALADEPEIFAFSLHCGENFPMRKAKSDLDVPVPEGSGDDVYMETLSAHLPALLDRFAPELVFYDAGVDPHREDSLGRLLLTDEGLARRDEFVLRACRNRGLPTACVIGGGYSNDVEQLARRHAILHERAHALNEEAERLWIPDFSGEKFP